MKIEKTTVRKIEGNLKKFRESLKEKGYTEIKTIYRAGSYVVEYITATLSLAELRDLGLIKPRSKNI